MTPEVSALPRDPDFATLRRFVLSWTGLEYYGNREQDLAQRIQRRLTASGIVRVSDYLALVRSQKPEGQAERDALIDAVTIGETYFFRFNEQFDALTTQILPALLKREQKTLRIWCAGCSNGSEPYTLSILLRKNFGDILRDWDIQILGTDINARALNQAREGWYHSWALRTLDSDQRRALFEYDTQKGRYVVKTAFRRGVEFARQNLVQDAPPAARTGAWDMIFCRNVLIYFDAPTIEQMVTKFAESLAPSGYLFLGHAEPGPGIPMERWFDIVRVPGALLYHRHGVDGPGAKPPPSIAPGPLYVPPAVEPTVQSAPWTPPQLEVTPSAPVPVSAPPAGLEPASVPAMDDVHREIRRLLDAGLTREALARLEPLLSSAKGFPALRHDPVLHYYQSLALEREERWGEAEAAVRRALYLDRSFLLAHYQQATLLERRGDIAGAVRVLDTVQRIADSSRENTKPLEQLAEVGDLTIGEMREIVALKRATLQRLLS